MQQLNIKTMKDLLYLIAICKRADNFERGWLMLKRWYGEFYWGDKSEHHFNFYGAIPLKVLAENKSSRRESNQHY
jgi:hypothetical protein